MFRVLYLCAANQPFSSGDLSELMQKAKARNHAAHITGCSSIRTATSSAASRRNERNDAAGSSNGRSWASGQEGGG